MARFDIAGELNDFKKWSGNVLSKLDILTDEIRKSQLTRGVKHRRATISNDIVEVAVADVKQPIRTTPFLVKDIVFDCPISAGPTGIR